MNFAKFWGVFSSRAGFTCVQAFSGRTFSPASTPTMDTSSMVTSPTDNFSKVIFTTRQITDGITPWSTLPIDIFLTRKNLDKQFSVLTRPQLIIPRPNKCLTDVFPTRCILEQIFPRPVKYLKQPIADNSVDKTFMN